MERSAQIGFAFFETPAVEQAIRTMPSLNASNYMKQTTKFFPQRLKFRGLENSSPEGYKQAVQLLGGPDDVFTPLWWAKSKKIEVPPPGKLDVK